jgi:hypothetical protein
MNEKISPLRRARAALLILAAASPGALLAPVRAQDAPYARRPATADSSPARTPEAVVEKWPEGSRDVARVMIEKYGEPERFSDDALIWRDSGAWKRSVVYRSAWPRFFGGRDKDYLEQSIGYRVPDEAIPELGRFDKRIRVDQVSGELSARSESEPMNFLMLNLAEEIATGKRTAEDAREVYLKVVEFYEAGKSSPYLNGFVFSSDTDRFSSPGRFATHGDFFSPGNP